MVIKRLLSCAVALCALTLAAPVLATELPEGVARYLADRPGTHKIGAATLLERLAKGEKIILLDVRTAQEQAVVRVPGSLRIPYDQLAGRLEEIPREGLVVIVCHTGRRAEGATAVLRILGYTNVVTLSGGINALTAATTPTTAPSLQERGVPAPPGTANGPGSGDPPAPWDADEDMGC